MINGEPMRDLNTYLINHDLVSAWRENPVLTFIGLYFGFPECCVKQFCLDNQPNQHSLFYGSGYVPCIVCDSQITNEYDKNKHIMQINKHRSHNYLFGNDELTHNPMFYDLLYQFFINNKISHQETYKHILYMNAYDWSFKRLLNKNFDLDVVYKDGSQNEQTVKMSDRVSFYAIHDFVSMITQKRMTKEVREYLLEMMWLEENDELDIQKTKENIVKLIRDIEMLNDKIRRLDDDV